MSGNPFGGVGSNPAGDAVLFAVFFAFFCGLKLYSYPWFAPQNTSMYILNDPYILATMRSVGSF